METAVATAPGLTSADERLGKLLNENVRIVMLRVRGVPRNRKVPSTTVMLGDKELSSKDVSAPTLHILNDKWRAEFGAVEGEARRILQAARPAHVPDMAFALDVPGCYVIAASRLPEIEKSIQALQVQKFQPLVQRLVQAYPEILKELAGKVDSGAIWDRIRQTLPSVHELGSRLALELRALPYTFIGEIGRKEAQEVAQTILQGILQGVEGWTSGYRDRIKGSGVFKAGSMTELRNQLQLIQDFRFLMDASTLAKAQIVEESLKDLGGDEAHLGLNKDLKTAAKAAAGELAGALSALTREVSQDAGGRYRRKIDI